MTRAKILFALLGGAAVGLTVGIMLAPDKGSTTRENIKEQASDLADRILTLVDQLLNEVEHRARKEEQQ
jgi:gas vesicle protein